MVHGKVSDEVVFGEESTYGTLPGTFTEQLGAIEEFTYEEVENVQEIGSVGSGHNPVAIEDGIYLVQGTLRTKPTKSSFPRICELVLGNRVDATDYTVTDTTNVTSLSAKAQHNTTETCQITGLVFKNLKFEMTKEGFLIASMDYIGQKLTVATETITYTQPTDSIFSALDISGTYAGNAMRYESLNLSFDWNINDTDGRGIETSTDRRVIKAVIKNNLTITGDFEATVPSTINDLGYADERVDNTMVTTINRGTDNQHVITLTGTRLDNKRSDEGTEGIKTFTANIAAGLDVTITGDL